MGEGDTISSDTNSHAATAAAVTAARKPSDEDERTRITPLHIALWNGNPQQIEDGLKANERALETRDPRGHRALHLALKFAHRNSKSIVKRLLTAGARVRSRDLDGWKTIHHAIASENEDILRLLVPKEKEQAPLQLYQKINAMATRLAQVPDFQCAILVDVATWIPGVSRWLPSDTVKIWKRGTDLRFDMTLVGFENGAWQRGNLSFLLLGGPCQFLCLDHKEQTCTNLLSNARGAALSDSELDDMVHCLMTRSIVTTFADVSALSFTRKRAWLTQRDVVESIGLWRNCSVYDMTGVEMVLHMRQPQNTNHKGPNGRSSTSIDPLAAALDGVAQNAYVDVEIEPKADHVVSVELAANETLTWKFRTLNLDIKFSVGFLTDTSDDSNSNGHSTSNGHGAVHQVVESQRFPATDVDHTGSFMAPRSGTVVLKWDNTYSLFRAKTIRFQLAVGASDSGPSDDWDSHRASEQLASFEDWFGVAIADLPDDLRALHPKPSTMVHQPPPQRTIKKSFSATVYTSDAFPLTVEQFLPIVEVLSKTTSAFENTREFFSTRLDGGFPVQFCFPLVPSVSATLRFDTMELSTPDASLFAVPEDYKQYQEDMFSPRTHHDMLQNMTAM